MEFCQACGRWLTVRTVVCWDPTTTSPDHDEIMNRRENDGMMDRTDEHTKPMKGSGGCCIKVAFIYSRGKGRAPPPPPAIVKAATPFCVQHVLLF